MGDQLVTKDQTTEKIEILYDEDMTKPSEKSNQESCTKVGDPLNKTAEKFQPRNHTKPNH